MAVNGMGKILGGLIIVLFLFTNAVYGDERIYSPAHCTKSNPCEKWEKSADGCNYTIYEVWYENGKWYRASHVRETLKNCYPDKYEIEDPNLGRGVWDGSKWSGEESQEIWQEKDRQ